MPYNYLDNNIWNGVGAGSQAMGDAFNRAIVGIAQLRYQQQQQAQQAAFEAQRIDLERQRLQQAMAVNESQLAFDKQKFEGEAPKRAAETAFYQSGSEAERAKTAGLLQQRDLGALVNAALQTRQAVAAPGANASTMQLPPQLSAALPAGQYTQDQMMRALSGIISGAGGQVSLQSPSSAVGNLAQAMYMQSPEGLKEVAVGGQQRQYLTPEQEAMIRLGIPLVEGAIKPVKDPTHPLEPAAPDVQAGADIASQIRSAMFPGSTNNASVGPRQAPQQAQQAPLTATNPKTKKRIVSYDGGQTWQPMQ